MVVGVAVVERDRERARRQRRPALDAVDELVERQHAVGAPHVAHLAPEDGDRQADVGRRVWHLGAAVRDRVVAQHDGAAPSAREGGDREQSGVEERALHEPSHST